MNEIVKYGNKLNGFNYGRFSAVESDLFFTLIAKVKDSDGILVMSFDELKDLSNYYSRDRNRFLSDVEDTFTKYLNLKYKEINGEITSITNVFTRLVIDRNRENILVEVTPGMEDVILSVSEQFTRFELQEFTTLKSSYSKSLYRLLKQWRSVGRMQISIGDFRFRLDIPESYRMTDITRHVLEPSVKELSAYFSDLKYEKLYSKKGKGKGRPSVEALLFTFVPEKADGIPREPSQSDIARCNGWQQTPRYCPKCHRPIYQKQFENNNGSYFMYAHTDWKTGKCSYKTFDYSDLLDDFQLTDKTDSAETEERKKNKNRLSDMLGGLFGK